jgi:hypothetical protein
VSGATERPVPLLDDTTRDFWTGGALGELRITRCSACEQLFHPPASICPLCAARAITHVTVSGIGYVDAFTVVHRPWIRGYDTPYVVARVRLREQSDVVLVTNLVDCDHAVHTGMEVEVLFEPRGDTYVPMFRPAV